MIRSDRGGLGSTKKRWRVKGSCNESGEFEKGDKMGMTRSIEGDIKSGRGGGAGA